MESASKALIMAGVVLLSVLIITVAVALFRSLGSSSAAIMEEIEKSRIAEFNNQFLKYYGQEDGITAHDIVTMANLANKNNREFELEDSYANGSIKPRYIRMDVKYPGGVETMNYFEKKCQQDKFVKEFLSQKSTKVVNVAGKQEVQTIKYKITSIEINPSTGTVWYIKIEPK